MTGNGIPIELWIDAQDGKPGDPAFEEWLKCCTEVVDDYEAMTGKKDRDSVFAEYVRKYGRREKICERTQEIKEKLFNGDQ